MGIRLLDTKELDLFFGFVRKYYREDYPLLSPVYLRWQFGGAEESDTYRVYCFWDKDECLHGFLGFQRALFRIDEQLVPGIYLMNLMTSVEKRNTAVGVLLLEAAFRAHKVVLCNGLNEKAAQAFTWNKSARMLGNLKKYCLILDAEKARCFFGGKDTDYAMIAKAQKAPVRTTFPSMSGRSCNGILRDADYLRWRYLKHPYFKYDVAVKDGNILVSRVEVINASKVCHIVDMQCHNAEGLELMDALLRTCQEFHISFVQCLVSSRVYGNLLAGFGFKAMNDLYEQFAILFNPVTFDRRDIRVGLYLSPDMVADASAYDIDRWLVTRGDGDQDRVNSLCC